MQVCACVPVCVGAISVGQFRHLLGLFFIWYATLRYHKKRNETKRDEAWRGEGQSGKRAEPSELTFTYTFNKREVVKRKHWRSHSMQLLPGQLPLLRYLLSYSFIVQVFFSAVPAHTTLYIYTYIYTVSVCVWTVKWPEQWLARSVPPLVINLP